MSEERKFDIVLAKIESLDELAEENCPEYIEAVKVAESFEDLANLTEYFGPSGDKEYEALLDKVKAIVESSRDETNPDFVVRINKDHLDFVVRIMDCINEESELFRHLNYLLPE